MQERVLIRITYVFYWKHFRGIPTVSTVPRKYYLSLVPGNLGSNGLFTWREGAPANRATRLEGLTHGPLLHATHLTGTVSGLRHGLSFERPLTATNKMADQRNFWRQVQFFITLFQCLRLLLMVTTNKIHLALPCFRGFLG